MIENQKEGYDDGEEALDEVERNEVKTNLKKKQMRKRNQRR